MSDEDLDVVAYDSLAERKAKVLRIAKVAAELGTRAAARRLGVNKDTVTRCLRLAYGAEPSKLTLRVERDGPRGYKATASGTVRKFGKRDVTVRFSCEVKALTIRDALEAVTHQAMVAARKKAGRV